MQPAVDPVLVGARLLLALCKLVHEPHVAAQLGRAVEGDTASTVDAITLLEEVADRGVHLHAHEKQRDCVEMLRCTQRTAFPGLTCPSFILCMGV